VEGHFTRQRHLGENIDQHLVAGKGKRKEKGENIYSWLTLFLVIVIR